MTQTLVLGLCPELMPAGSLGRGAWLVRWYQDKTLGEEEGRA